MQRQISFMEANNLLKPFKLRILQFTIVFSICIFCIITERIFKEVIMGAEISALISIQKAFGVDKQISGVAFYILANLQEQEIFLILSMHVLSVIYFKYDRIIALKVMLLLYASWYVIIMLELLYHSPQPFWKSGEISTYMCDQKFGSPADTSLLTSILLYGIIYQFTKQTEKSKRIKIYVISSIIFFIYCFLVYVSGQGFIIDLLLGMVYFTLIFSLAVRYDDALTDIIQHNSKMRPFYILFGSALMFFIAMMYYNFSYHEEDIVWVQNFFKCKERESSHGLYHNYQFDHVIGSEPTFTQMVIIICIVTMGITNLPINRASDAQLIIIQLAFIPGWAFILTEGWLTELKMQQLMLNRLRYIGISQMIIDSFIFGGLHWWIFGYVGKKLTRIDIGDYQLI